MRIAQSNFENLHSKDKYKQYEAFNWIIAAVKEKVDRAYEVLGSLKG